MTIYKWQHIFRLVFDEVDKQAVESQDFVAAIRIVASTTGINANRIYQKMRDCQSCKRKAIERYGWFLR